MKCNAKTSPKTLSMATHNEKQGCDQKCTFGTKTAELQLITFCCQNESFCHILFFN